MSSEATMKRLFRRGGMLLVTLEVMPGIGHFPQLEDPEWISERLTRWFKMNSI